MKKAGPSSACPGRRGFESVQTAAQCGMEAVTRRPSSWAHLTLSLAPVDGSYGLRNSLRVGRIMSHESCCLCVRECSPCLKLSNVRSCESMLSLDSLLPRLQYKQDRAPGQPEVRDVRKRGRPRSPGCASFFDHALPLGPRPVCGRASGGCLSSPKVASLRELLPLGCPKRT